MKLRHTFAVMGMAVGLFALGGTSALAATTPPATSSGSGTVSSSVVSSGESVLFCGSGYAAGSTVRVSVDGKYVKSVTTNSSGSFCTRVRAFSSGMHYLRARGTGVNGELRIVRAALRVRASVISGSHNEASAGGSNGNSLPFTGGEVGLMAAGAALLIGTGAGARVVGRRRGNTAA